MAARRVRVIVLAACIACAFTARSAEAQTPNSGPIDALQKGLAALAARVAKLEGQGPITAADIAGTYRFFTIQHEVNAGQRAQIASYVENGTATFASGTVSFVGSPEVGYNLVQGNPWSLFSFNGHQGEAGTVNWKYDNGMVIVNPEDPEDHLLLTPTMGGRILLAVGANVSSSQGHTILMIFVRL